jgi:predicted alpha/beta superfamily hydrolase
MIYLRPLTFCLFLLVIAISENVSAQAQKGDTVLLFIELDMREPIAQGWLNPEQEIVGLRGDTRPLSWGNTYAASDNDNDGVFNARIPFVFEEKEISVSLKIKVDGTNNPDNGWQKGRNHVVAINRSEKNYTRIAWGDEPEELKPTFSGNIQRIDDLKDDSLKDRPVYVYLPPNYEQETDRTYPVLYLHDGQNVFDVRAVGREWEVDETAEKLIKNGAIEPLIIVAVGNTEDRIDEYTPTEQTWRHSLKRVGEKQDGDGRLSIYTGIFITAENDTIRIRERFSQLQVLNPGESEWQKLIAQSDSAYYQPDTKITLHFQILNSKLLAEEIIATRPLRGGNGNRYLTYLTNVVKPFVDKKYRTKPQPEYTALGGSSLGGLITMYAGLNYLEFRHLLVLSPSVWWDGQVLLKMVKEFDGDKNHSIWLYIGTGEGDDMVRNTERLKKLLKEKGWKSDRMNYLKKVNATHTEQAWANQGAAFLRWINEQYKSTN